MVKNIAIIGAGLSGLTLARQLAPHARVQVFEKARGAGGRMSTRYADPYSFDHGAQFFTARSPAFQSFLKPFIAAGQVAPWEGKVVTLQAGQKKPYKRLWFEPHYVAVPTMNSLCKLLSAGMQVDYSAEVAPLKPRQRDGWHLTDGTGTALGIFDWVISTAPPAQTVRLFSLHLLADAWLSKVVLQGCYTLMIGFDRPWDKAWIAAQVHESPLAWIAVNSSKPARNAEVTSLVVHSTHAWTQEHIDDEMGEAQAFLVAQFEKLTGIYCSKADYLTTHRWRYASVAQQQACIPYCDGALQLASTGDWCSVSRVEDVWLNAGKLATAILGRL